MEPREALRLWLVNAPDAARLAGLSVHTIRAIRDGKRRRIHPSTRAKLASAMRKHSEQAAAAADLLDPPPSKRRTSGNKEPDA